MSCDCKTPESEYDDKYDAYYCVVCNKWLEDKCSDKDCEFCSKRPERHTHCGCCT